MNTGHIVHFLIDNAVGVLGRVVVCALGVGLLALIIVVVTAVIAHKRKLLHTGARVDPWPHRVSIAAWVLVGVPAFAIAGALIGLGLAAGHIVTTSQVTEKVAHAGVAMVVQQIAREPEAAKLVHDEWIAVDDIGAFVERAPTALASWTGDHTQQAFGAAGGDWSIAESSGAIAGAMASWLVRSQAEDRLRVVTPVIADARARDTDHDGKITISDVVDSAVRVHLAPRAAGFARDAVMGHAAVPSGVGAGVVVVPLLACAVVRRRRGTNTPTTSA